MDGTLQSILKSWCSPDSRVSPTADIFVWIFQRNTETAIEIHKISLSGCAPWCYDGDEGCIRNENRSFFTITGYRQEKTDGSIKEKLSFVMIGLAFSIKMQAILLLPVWILLWYQRKKLILAHFLLIPGTYVIISIPALLAGKSIGTIFGLFGQFGTGAFGTPYQSLNNLSVFLLPTDPYIAKTLVNISIWFTIALVGISMLFWIVRSTELSNQKIFIASCLFYVVMITETLGGVHERHAMLADLISVILFFVWKKEWWFIPLVLNAHSFLGYVRYCTNRWDTEMAGVYMTTFMIEAAAYFLFACWLMVFLYKECQFKNKTSNPKVS